MARLPYAPLDHPTIAPLVQRIVAERGSVLELYQMLLHSAPLAEGWLAYLTAVRQKLELPGNLRELVIMRVAQLNGAPYEAAQHRPHALKEGVSAEQLNALEHWAQASVFTPRQRAVLALCDAITRQIHFAPALLQAVERELGTRQTVELVATVSAYNMVSRFLEALGIHPAAAAPPEAAAPEAPPTTALPRGPVMPPFHLAFPVHDLQAARAFYGDVLGCPEGRSSPEWIDFDFCGHQIVAHLSPQECGPGHQSTVDGHGVPVRHFGLVLSMEQWELTAQRLVSKGVPFDMEPQVRFKGEVGEQATMFFRDPSGNALELKAMADPSRLFAR